jgi:hypothetical protein
MVCSVLLVLVLVLLLQEATGGARDVWHKLPSAVFEAAKFQQFRAIDSQEFERVMEFMQTMTDAAEIIVGQLKERDREVKAADERARAADNRASAAEARAGQLQQQLLEAQQQLAALQV